MLLKYSTVKQTKYFVACQILSQTKFHIGVHDAMYTGMIFLADFRFFSFHILVAKVVGFFSSESYKTLFWTEGVGGFRLFMAFFRFFHAELSLMPVYITLCMNNEKKSAPRKI